MSNDLQLKIFTNDDAVLAKDINNNFKYLKNKAISSVIENQNLILNGDMSFAQNPVTVEGEGGGSVVVGNGKMIIDQWWFQFFNLEGVSTKTNAKYLFNEKTGKGSIRVCVENINSEGGYKAVIQQRLNNIRDVYDDLTLDFKVRSRQPGKYSVLLQNYPGKDAYFLTEYEIFEPNVWEHKVIHIPACPKDLGTWRINYDSLILSFVVSGKIGTQASNKQPYTEWETNVAESVVDQVIPTSPVPEGTPYVPDDVTDEDEITIATEFGTRFELSEVYLRKGWVDDPEPIYETEEMNRLRCERFFKICSVRRSGQAYTTNQEESTMILVQDYINSTRETPLLYFGDTDNSDIELVNCRLHNIRTFYRGALALENPFDLVSIIVVMLGSGYFAYVGNLTIDRNVCRGLIY